MPLNIASLDVISIENRMTQDTIIPHILPYNTDMPRITMPEYGRNIHELVNFCLSIPDREERTRCAFSIVETMAKLFPKEADPPVHKKLWDHLNIISGFSLDVDFPCPVVTEEMYKPAPEKIPYSDGNIHYRHYGRLVESLVRVVADMEEGEVRDIMIRRLANQMKKLLLITNKEGVSDARVLRDLEEYSDGKIKLNPETFLLHKYQQAELTKGATAKKKRKK